MGRQISKPHILESNKATVVNSLHLQTPIDDAHIQMPKDVSLSYGASLTSRDPVMIRSDGSKIDQSKPKVSSNDPHILNLRKMKEEKDKTNPRIQGVRNGKQATVIQKFESKSTLLGKDHLAESLLFSKSNYSQVKSISNAQPSDFKNQPYTLNIDLSKNEKKWDKPKAMTADSKRHGSD